ncbi:hypothetical protein [Eubacterium ramulus]|uniref:5-methylcytosine-specific restriction enzyme subunit McrC n=1 Tax=Eubacterium ramulus TaxID=39490 RepID=A0A173UEL4_EUBRA|nr:5-methylcytosine-specific restriction enzyme subunit McrC [Eubacterium ramulus]
MTIELKQEILDLIESPELYAYLMKYTERLKLRDYVEIIAGAPVSLKRKLGLLHKLRATTDLKQRDMEYMKLCCECMNQAVRYLTMESRTIFLIQLMGYDDDNKRLHTMNTMQMQYDKATLHSGNMYQIFTYVKNQDVKNTGNVSGMLLYAKTEEAITPDCSFVMGGNKISVKTLDLNKEFKLIAAQLDKIVEEYFRKM